MISSHLVFQPKSYKDLYKKIDIRLNFFCLFVNYIMKKPLILIWTVSYEKLSKFLRDR